MTNYVLQTLNDLDWKPSKAYGYGYDQVYYSGVNIDVSKFNGSSKDEFKRLDDLLDTLAYNTGSRRFVFGPAFKKKETEKVLTSEVEITSKEPLGFVGELGIYYDRKPEFETKTLNAAMASAMFTCQDKSPITGAYRDNNPMREAQHYLSNLLQRYQKQRQG